MKKRPWHLFVIAIFMILLYSMGIYDFFMMISHNTAYYNSHHYGNIVYEYFTNYPFYFLILWVTNLLGGIIAPILLLFKNKLSRDFALISTLAQFLLLTFTFAFRNRLEVFGTDIAVFDIFILIFTLCLYIYCVYVFRNKKKK